MSVNNYIIGKGYEIRKRNKKEKVKKPIYNNFLLAKYAGIGYYVGAPLLLGVFLGLLIDNFFKTKPLFIIIFIIIGTIGTFYNLFKTTKHNF